MRAWIVLGLLASVLLCGFGATVLAAEPQILRRGNLAEPDTLDPGLASTSWEHNVTADLFEGLTADGIDGQPIPGAAERWTTSDDGLVWTFHLRAGLKWSDGVPLKASDFVFGLRRLLDPKTAARYASLQYGIKNAALVNSGKLPLTALGVRAPDERTVEITLEGPAPYLPDLMSHYTAFPLPEHIVRQYGDTWAREGHMVSNGPFMLAEWRPHDRIRIVKNPLYHNAAHVRLDEVFFYPIEDEMVALNRFRAREIDANIGTKGFPIDQLSWLKENMPGEAHLEVDLANSYLVMNMRKAPFNDARLRRAVGLCIDVETIASKVVRDGRVPAYAFVPPGIANYRGTAQVDWRDWPMERRRAEARRLLADAGYGPDHPLTVEDLYISGLDARRAAIAEAAMLKQCGIVARLLANEAKVHYSKMQQFDFTLAKAAWIADFNDPQNFLYLLDSRSGPFNYGGYANPAFDALLDQARSTLDMGQRAAFLAQAEQMALDDAAVIPLSFTTSKELVASTLKGYAENPVDRHRSRWMWLER